MPATLTTSTSADEFAGYPLLLRAHHLAKILSLHEKTILAATVRGDRTKVPAPAFTSPYRWRRRDVQAFYDNANESDQRRARIRARGER